MNSTAKKCPKQNEKWWLWLCQKMTFNIQVGDGQLQGASCFSIPCWISNRDYSLWCWPRDLFFSLWFEVIQVATWFVCFFWLNGYLDVAHAMNTQCVNNIEWTGECKQDVSQVLGVVFLFVLLSFAFASITPSQHITVISFGYVFLMVRGRSYGTTTKGICEIWHVEGI